MKARAFDFKVVNHGFREFYVDIFPTGVIESDHIFRGLRIFGSERDHYIFICILKDVNSVI